MGGREWAAEEKALAVYFIYLGISYDGVSQMLKRRGFTRSKKGVSNMVRFLQNKERRIIPSLERSGADNLIDRLASGHEMSALLLPVDGDQETSDQVSLQPQ